MTLEKILRVFTKVNKQLNDFIVEKDNEIKDIEDRMAYLKGRYTEVSEEMGKAVVIRKNIENLVGE